MSKAAISRKRKPSIFSVQATSTSNHSIVFPTLVLSPRRTPRRKAVVSSTRRKCCCTLPCPTWAKSCMTRTLCTSICPLCISRTTSRTWYNSTRWTRLHALLLVNLVRHCFFNTSSLHIILIIWRMMIVRECEYYLFSYSTLTLLLMLQ